MVEQGPRKASDVLLELEAKVSNLLETVKAQNLINTILSNKLQDVINALKQTTNKVPQFSIEAAPISNTEKQIPVSSDFNLPLETNPQGFRRTSRPETYAGDNAYLPPKEAVKPVVKSAEIIAPNQEQKTVSDNKNIKQHDQNVVPVQQRVVDRNSKSVFLADVEILDLSTNQSVFKTRTNGTGKWMASLGVGDYRVLIRKMESMTKEKVEISQEIKIDGKTSPLELQMIIIK